MIPPDFEISARLRAEKLVTRVPPDAQTAAEGGDVTLARQHTRPGLSGHLQAAGGDGHVAVEKRVVGRLRRRGD